MIKKKQPKTEEEDLQEAIDEIKQRFGEGAIMKLSDVRAVDIDVIPTGSISLDLALGVGGVPRGRVIEIFGAEATGKTTLALHVLAEAQKKGGVGAFVDAEHALDPDYAKRIGVNVDDLLISQPDSGEQALQIVEALMRSGKVDVIVIDSVAALTPKAEIAGEIGDQHIGLQARLMSATLRRLASVVAKTKTSVIFLNQTRMKIGVMWGCLNYKSKINLSDGTTEWIGKIVNQRKPVSVLSYDWRKGKIIPRKIIQWYRNGPTDKFLQITAYKPYDNGATHFACTLNHPILTPTGWRKAEDLLINDLILVAAPFRLSPFQLEIIRGNLLGDGSLSKSKKNKNSLGIKFRLSHGLKQKRYLEWELSLLKNIPHTIWADKKSIRFDLTPLPELFQFRKEIYRRKYKFFSADYLANLTPLSLAIWYMDDAHLDIRDLAQTKGRIQICVKKIHPESRNQLQNLLESRYDIKTKIGFQGTRPVLTFDQKNTDKFLNLIKHFIHPSMDYKLLPKYRGKFSIKPTFSEIIWKPISVPIINIKSKPRTRSMMRFDIGVQNTHNFLVNGAIVHNSPITTPGGLALKFYASVRIELKRIAQIKQGEQITGSRIKAKIVKNKVAAPFKIAEFDIFYNEGISYFGDIVSTGIKAGIIKKAGSWLQYENVKLGQGVEGAKKYLRENPAVAKKIRTAIPAALLSL